MASANDNSDGNAKWIALVLLLLGLWWWLRRKQPAAAAAAPAAATTTTTAAAVSAEVPDFASSGISTLDDSPTGSSQGGYGYAPGSAATPAQLLNLVPESIAKINQWQWIDSDGINRGPLYDSWRSMYNNPGADPWDLASAFNQINQYLASLAPA